MYQRQQKKWRNATVMDDGARLPIPAYATLFKRVRFNTCSCAWNSMLGTSANVLRMHKTGFI